MFPKKKKTFDNVNFTIGIRFLQKDLQLTIDRKKCTGCGICATVCPKDAIFSGPKIKGKDDNLHQIKEDAIILDVSDPETCVYCGTCTVFCPFDAIKLYIDGRAIPIEELDLVKKNALPKLEGKKEMMKATNSEAHVYMEGSVEIKKIEAENEKAFKMDYINTCPGECKKCIDICPNEALKIIDYNEALKTGKEFGGKIIKIASVPILVDDEKCIACGACVMSCPSDRIILKRDKIMFSGPYTPSFLKTITDKLGVPLDSNN
ncbi:MAG: 4Fe-4S dicluster domain-containing protein [archaeon]|nr:4Fe-4S dicluster domain-containing protein [archaeon]